MFDNDWIRKNVKCCACSRTLETSRFINVVRLEKLATWKFPVFGHVDTPGYEPRAAAIVCDECTQKKEKILYCIEGEGSLCLVKYHEVESLEDGNKSESRMKYYFGKKFREDMEIESENPTNGGLEKVKKEGAKIGPAGSLPAGRAAVENVAGCPPLPACAINRGGGEDKMKNPVYYRLMKDRKFAGFKRIVTEYLPAGHSVWRLARVDHDPGETQKLSRAAMGIENLKSETIIHGRKTIKKRGGCYPGL